MLHDKSDKDEKQKLSSLECKEYDNYLGNLLDKNLSFKKHIDQRTIKISKTVGVIANLRHFLPKNTILQIYNSLIAPYISYAIQWNHGLTIFGITIFPV